MTKTKSYVTKLLAVVLMLTMLLSSMSLTVSAATEILNPESRFDRMTAEQQLQYAMENGGTVTLEEDVVLGDSLSLPAGVTVTFGKNDAEAAAATYLYVNCDYNSSTEGYGVTKFSNYAGAYAYAVANGKTSATIVVEKTNTLSGNTFDNNHKNYSRLAVVIQDGATMGNAASKWDMTYPVTVEPGGTLTCARPKTASVSYIHIKNTLTVGAAGSDKKAVVDFLSDSYQDCDISIRYNGKIVVNNAIFNVQDLDAQGALTINDSTVEIDGAFASAAFFATTLTNTEMTVNGNQISGGISDFAGGDANQLGNVTINNSTLTIKEGTTKVAANVTVNGDSSAISVADLTVNSGKKITVNDNATIEADTLTNNGTIAASATATVSATTVVEESTGKVTIGGSEATLGNNGQFALPVAQIGDNKYEILQAAIAAAQNGETVALLADVKQADGIIITDKNITIDLNGKTFTVTEGASTNNRNFKINGTSVVTIKNGTLVAAGDYSSGTYGTVRTEDTATVTLTGLKLYNYRGNGLNIKACGGSKVVISDTEIYSQYGGGIEAAGGTIEVTDVTVEQKGMYVAPYNSMAISVNGGGKVTVWSGTFSTECLTAEEANNQGASHGPWTVGVLNSGGTLIIHGGTFSNNNYGDNEPTAPRGLILADTAAKIEIYGGTFNAMASIVDIQNNLGDAANQPTAFLAGGTFSADPTDITYATHITLPVGYQVVENDDGTYGIGKIPPSGTLSHAYTSDTTYWGECGGNALESFVFKFYNGNTYMGYTSLNNVDGIIDGDVYVSWSIMLDAASNTDPYWTMAWEIAPTLAMQPTRVEQWVDGVKVAECVIQPNWSDSIFPVVAAVTDDEGKILSYVNGTAGATLADALANGGNVVLLRDVVLTETVTIPAGVVVNLDLNGYTLSYVSATVGEAMITNKGNLTVNDTVGGGKIVYTYTGEPDTSYGKGNYTISNVGTLTLNAGTIENATAAMSHACYAIDNNSINSAATLVIENGKVLNTNNYAIRQIAGSNANSVTVNGGEITGTRAIWIQLPGSNTSAAPVVGLTVTGGTLTGTKVDSSDNQLAVYSYSYGNDMGNVTVAISGGTFVGDVALTGGKNKTNIETVTVTGGTFTGRWGELYSYGDDAKAQAAITIKGGTFATDEAAFYATDDGFEFIKNENGTYGVVEKPMPTVDGVNVTVVDNGNGSYDIDLVDGNFPEGGVDMTFPATGDVNDMAYVVHEHGGVRYIYVGKVSDGNLSFKNTVGFSTFTVNDGGLAEAFAAAKDGDTITLVADVTVDSETYTVADGVAITLNMNGKTITVTDNKASNVCYELFYILGEMTVTGNGTIELTSTSNDTAWAKSSTIFHNRGGELTIENGTFTHLGGTAMAFVVDNSGNWYGDATTTVKAGTLTSSYIAIRNRMEQNEHGASGKATLNIEGGTISGTSRAIWAQAASVSETAPATGAINVSGGEIGLIDTPRNTGAVSMTTITGGTVAAVKCEAGELTVTGGTVGELTILDANGAAVDYAITADGLYVTAVAQVGDDKYASVLEAILAAIEAGASEVKLLKDSREVMPTDVELILNADLKITADSPITASFYNNGTNYDFIINSNNNNTFTIGENVTFSLEDRVIWLGYYGNNVDVVIDGKMSAYQIWHGADTTVNETGVLETTGEALVMRRGATMTVNGGKVKANYFNILAGNIEATNATITSGAIWVSNTGSYVGEGSVYISLDDTTWTSTGNIKLNSDATVLLEINNGSTLSATDFDGYGASVISENASVWLDGGSLTVKTLTNNGDLDLSNGSSLTATGVVSGKGSFVADATSSMNIPNSAAASVNGSVYFSLAAAFEAAQVGDEIILVGDVTLTEALTIPAGVIFNGNGKTVNGTLTAGGDVTFKGYTKVTTFNAGYNKPVITIPAGATLEMTSGRMVIGHGATFNITGNITDAKTADVADLTPSLIAPGASFTGAGVTFNVTNAYLKFTYYCSSKEANANGTFNFNVTNSIWEQDNKVQFSVPANGMDPIVNFYLTDSVLNSTSHLVFAVTKGEIVFDNSNVNVGAYKQLENRSTLTIKNGSVVYASVATSQNATNPGTTIVDNATYVTTGTFGGADVGTGTLVLQNNAQFTTGTLAKVNVTVDATSLLTATKADTATTTITVDGSKLATGSSEKVIDLSASASIEGIVTVNGNGVVATFGDDGDVTLAKVLVGSGTAEDPYQIGSVDDLIFFRKSVNLGETTYNAPGVYVALTADIDMDGATWERGIGDGINATFDGIFDGKGHTIKNLNFAPKADDENAQTPYLCGGLFGYTYGAAVIKNLVLENITVTTSDAGHNVGILVGFAYNKGGKLNVSNVTVKNVVIDAPNAYGVGAIVGYSYFDMGTIENCVVDGATITGYSFVGGITGYSYSNAVITGCTVTNATITANSYSAGGIVGIVLGGNKVTGNTVSDTTVTATANAATVVGAIASEGIVVENNTAAEPQVGGSYSDNKPVAAKIGNKYYTTIAAAIAAAAENDTITLLADVTLTETIEVLAGKTITLDLNGKTLSVAYAEGSTTNHIYAITNNGTLTITGNGTIDTRGIFNYGNLTLVNGTINVIDPNGGYGVRNYPGAIFTMNGGTISATTDDGDAPGEGYDATTVRVDEGATFVMNGGVLKNTNNYTFAIDNYGTTTVNAGTISSVHTTVANYGTLTINGGTFTCDGIEGITAHVVWAAEGTTTITGGTFNGKDNYNGFNVIASKGATVAITGGTFRDVHSGSLYGEGTIAVSGGIFFDKISAERCADGFAVTDNGDGTYGVKFASYIVLPDGVDETNYVEKFGDNTVTDGVNYYKTLKDALLGIHLTGNRVLYCKPGADLGTMTHGHVCADLTVYGNDAYIPDGEQDFEVDTYKFCHNSANPCDGLTEDLDLVIKNLHGAAVWGQRTTAYTINVTLEGCEDINRIYINGTSGVNNITLTGCTFTANSNTCTVYSNADGVITITNCAFSDVDEPINLNHKASGTQTVTVTDCTFTNCGSTAYEWEAPIRVTSSAAGGKTVLTVDGCTFTNCVGTAGADILVDDGAGLTTATISNTAANVVVEREKNSYESTTLTATGTAVFDNLPYVAKIGDKGYTSLAAAIQAAVAGDIVTILAGDYTGGLTVNKAITVIGQTDDEGNALVNISGKLSITADGAAVKNLNFNNGSGNGGYINAKDVLVEGCTIVGGNGFRNCYTKGTVTFKDSTITGGTYGIHFDGSAGGEIVIDNCVITGWTSFARTITKVTMTDTKFENGNYNYVRFYQEDVVIDGCTFNENMAVDLAVSNATLTITNSTLENGNVEDLFSGDDMVNSTITVDGVELVRVAQIGDDYYETLQDALAAAQDGDVITLHDNVTVTEKLNISQNITISLNDKTLTLATGGNEIRSSVKIENGTLAIADVDTKATGNSNCFISVNVGGELTLANVTMTGNGYTTYWAVICAMSNSDGGAVVNIVDSSITLSGEKGSAGGFFKDQSGVDNYSTLNVENSTITLTNVSRGFTGAKVVLNGVALTITGGEHGINGSELSITDSTVIIKNGTGRAITLSKFDVEIINSELTLANMGEGEIRFKTANTLTIDADSTLNAVTAYADVDGAMVNDKAVTGNEVDMSTVSFANGELTVVNPVYVAEINGTNYKTLAEALKAAQAGDVITLLDDITISDDWDCRYNGAKLTVPVTIDGNNHTLKLTGKVDDKNWNTVFRFEADATVKNLTIDVSEATSVQRGISAKLGITVDNVTFIGNGTTCRRAIIFGEGAGSAIANVTATITNSTFMNWSYGVSDNANAQDAKSVTITGSRFENANVLVSASDSVTFNNNVMQNGEVNITSYSETNALTVTAQGNTLSGEENCITAATIVAQDGFLTPVAQIGGKLYLTLADAFEAAKKGDVIELLANVTLTEQITVADNDVLSDITLDGNGYTITANMDETKSPLYFGGNGTYATGVKIMDLTIDATDARFGIMLYGGTASTLTNVTVMGNYEYYGINLYGTHGAMLTNCNVISLFTNGQDDNALLLVNTTIGHLYANKSDAADDGAKVFIDTDSHVTELTFWGNSTVMIDAASFERIGTVHATLVAEIDGVYYTDLQSAIDAAQSGETIEIIADAKIDAVTVVADKNITIDLNGNDIVFVVNTAAAFSGITNRGTLNVINSSMGEARIYCEYQAAGSTAYAVNTITNCGTLTLGAGVTVENCSLASNQIGYAVDNNSTSGNAVLVIEGATVVASGSNYYDAIRMFSNSETNENSVTVTAGTVSSIWMQNPSDGSADRNTKDVKASLTITGGEVANIYLEPSAGFTASVTGGTIGEISAFETAAGRDLAGFISGGTFTTAPDATFIAKGYMLAGTDGSYGVVVDPAYGKVAFITKDGATTYYETLAAAITAAKEGDVITLMAKVTENVTVSKSVTIDGANFTYTGTMTVNSDLTITVQNVNFVNGGVDKSTKSTKGKYTIKDCTFEGEGTYAYAFRFKGANTVTIEDCTVSNYLYSFLYITASTNKVSVKNVTVDNCPSYAVYFASGVTTATFENVTVKNGNNGFILNNTANRTFTIKNCTMENVATAIKESNGTNTITCKVLGENNFGNATISQYAKINLAATDATLTAVEGLNVTTNLEGYDVFYKNGKYVVGITVAKIGDEKYTSIQEAIDAATDGDVITIVRDMTFTVDDNYVTTKTDATGDAYSVLYTVSGEKAVTIDLNGKVMNITVNRTAPLFGIFAVETGSSLTLTDSSEDNIGAVNVTATSALYAMFMAYNEESTMSITGGNYSVDKVMDAGSLIYAQHTNLITVSGGNFHLGNLAMGSGGNGSPWIVNVKGANDGYVTITGGTFNDDINHQFWANEIYVPGTKALKNNGDGTYTVVDAVAYVEETGNSTGSTARKVGYATIIEAILAAPDGGTVYLMPGTYDEKLAPWATDSTHKSEKSITIKGAQAWMGDGNETILTGGLYLGYDDSGCREHNIVIEGITFEGKGILVAGQQNVTIRNNVFNNITECVATASSATANAISVIGKDVNAVVTGNVINTTASGGIHLRDTASVVITGNTVKDVQNNAITVPNNGTAGTIVITDNVLETWGLSGEGRAIRTVGGTSVTVTGNVMTCANAPEEFAKLTGTESVDASANYWNGENPRFGAYLTTTLTSDPALTLKSYYTDAGKTTLVEIAPSAAQIGNNYYATLAEAFAAIENGDTVVLLTDVTLDSETYTIADGVAVTLDMNGKTITVTDNKTSNYELFYIYGEMTVTGDGTITLTSTNDRDWNAMSAIFHNRGGVLTIENGTFKNLGGTDMAWVVDNSGNYYGDATTNIEGGTLDSAYIAIRNRMEQNDHGASGKAILNVSGGTISGVTRAIWAQAASTSTTAPATGEINISGGEIGWIDTARSAGAVSMTTITGGTVAAVTSEIGELTVTGGTVDTVTTMTADGTTIVYVVDANGLYVSATVAIGNVGYASLADAIANAQNDDVITLLDSIAYENGEYVTVPAGKVITIDLNGKTISGVDTTEKNFGLIQNNGTLTITDSSDDATGTIKLAATVNSGWNRYSAVISNNPGATLVINGGTLEHQGGTDMAYGIDSLTNGGLGDVSVTINGGTIKSTYRAIRQFLNSATAQNVLTINGGVVEGTNKGIFFHDPSTKANNGTLTIGANATVSSVYLFVTEGSTEWPVKVSIAGDAVTGEITSKNVPMNYEVTIGENNSCTVDQVNHVVEINGKYYKSLQDALNQAQDGDTVTLVGDVDATGSVISSLHNIIIDLNGHTITAAAMVLFGDSGHIVDNGETKGMVQVPEGYLIMTHAGYPMLPVWNEEGTGYIFVEVVNQSAVDIVDDDSFTVRFRPSVSGGGILSTDLLADGAADNGLTMSLHIHCIRENGEIEYVTVDISDELIATVYTAVANGENKAIQVKINGAGMAFDEYRLEVVLESDTGITYIGQAGSFIPGSATADAAA